MALANAVDFTQGHVVKDDRGSVFGAGNLSSSDGQRFTVRGKSLSGRDVVIHGGQVLSTYTHVTDQHYVLDEILGNATHVPVTIGR